MTASCANRGGGGSAEAIARWVRRSRWLLSRTADVPRRHHGRERHLPHDSRRRVEALVFPLRTMCARTGSLGLAPTSGCSPVVAHRAAPLGSAAVHQYPPSLFMHNRGKHYNFGHYRTGAIRGRLASRQRIDDGDIVAQRRILRLEEPAERCMQGPARPWCACSRKRTRCCAR
jgi:hypothetical protein